MVVSYIAACKVHHGQQASNIVDFFSTSANRRSVPAAVVERIEDSGDEADDPQATKEAAELALEHEMFQGAAGEESDREGGKETEEEEEDEDDEMLAVVAAKKAAQAGAQAALKLLTDADAAFAAASVKKAALATPSKKAALAPTPSKKAALATPTAQQARPEPDADALDTVYDRNKMRKFMQIKDILGDVR